MPGILFLTLKTFSKTGGIEKVCRVVSKALFNSHHINGGEVKMYSLYDSPSDASGNPYFNPAWFKGFAENKFSFIKSATLHARKFETVLLSHINLLPVGWMIKTISPKTKVILLAHGIEVWPRLGTVKRMMLKRINKIISVSNFTKSKLETVNGIPEKMIEVLNNCLDPLLPLPEKRNSGELRKRLSIPGNAKVMLTLTRLSVTERKKGYLDVISAMSSLSTELPQLYYVIAGGYDEEEKNVIIKRARECKVADRIIVTGFIPDNELPQLFGASDIYIMPSEKEGFGIVFIEALYYGLPVIGGNADGTSDALKNGEWGTLVTPGNIKEIERALLSTLKGNTGKVVKAEDVLNEFGFEQYSKILNRLLN